MGADLYINPIYKPRREQWQQKFDSAVNERNCATLQAQKDDAQKRVDEAYDNIYADEGYFRDSYNGTGILSIIGLSWWRDLETDTDPDSNADGNNMSVAACQAFLAKLKAAGPPASLTFEDLRGKHCTVDEGENSPDVWNDFFTKKYNRLVSFFERAIEYGGLSASV